MTVTPPRLFATPVVNETLLLSYSRRYGAQTSFVGANGVCKPHCLDGFIATRIVELGLLACLAVN